MSATQDLDELLRRRFDQQSDATRTSERAAQTRALRAWQSARLVGTYDDLLREPLYADAVRFFLVDLYGPEEHTRRDQDLRRAAAPLKRTLPQPVLAILARALELQVLTAQLDRAMVEQIGPATLTWKSYAPAYRAVGQAEARKRQIDLMVSLGEDLDRVVRHDWVVVALRAARLPAQLAGFGVLQDFLERGFAAFNRMPDPRRLLDAVRERETRLSAALLNGHDDLPEIAGAAIPTSPPA